MRNIIYKLNLIFIFIICSLLLSFSLTKKVNADTLITKTEMEVCDLDSVIDFYYGEDYCAIIKNSKTFLISKNGGEFKPVIINSEDPSLKQVKRLNDTTLLISDTANIKKIDLSKENTVSNLGISTNSFDTYQNYLATAFGADVKVYNLNLSTENTLYSNIDSDTPICIYENFVYCVEKSDTNSDKNSDLIKSDLIKVEFNQSTLKKITKSTILENVSPKKMITNGTDIFYTLNGKNNVYKVNIASKEQTTYSFNDDDTFDLDSISNITNLSFKGENLLISSSSYISEYKINGDKLVFTGFAIAKNKSAFNRISKNALDIERNGNNVAVLDQNKLTVINLNDFDAYSEDSFINMHIGDAPSKFALGKKGVLVYKENLTYDTFSGKTTEINSQNVKSIIYQNGKFYFADDTGIYSFSEENLEITKISDTVIPNDFTIDVFGNVYETRQKSCTDLEGNLYTITSNNLVIKNTNGENETVIENVKTFSLSYDLDRIYYLKPGDEKIYYIDGKISAISDFESPEIDFSSPKNTFTKYSVKTDKTNVNVYKVDLSDNLQFNRLLQKEEEYIFVKELNDKFGLFASPNGFSLINMSDLNEKELIIDSIEKTVFLSTKAHAYYYPVINIDNLFTLNNGETVLKNTTEFKVENKITHLNIDFYYGSYNSDGETIYCFVPVNFTVDSLFVEPSIKFTTDKVKQVIVYNDATLDESICELQENTKIRILETNGKIAKISYENNGEWKIGYIQKSKIINENQNWIRNVLIIFAVITCICGSATYFILNQKNKEQQE
ncbi:MAG: hypothetical protein MJ066_04645 [Clostridia bacterium]|nr:hypothetical protein [Clostridia bacterium]